MSDFDDDFAAAATPDFLEVFGETVQRLPLGDANEAVDVTAIVDLSREDANESLREGGEQYDDRGSRIRRHGVLLVSTGVAVNALDHWTIRDELWRTRRIVARQADLQAVHLFRTIGQKTRKARLANSDRD